jgi:hypothetical protein
MVVIARIPRVGGKLKKPPRTFYHALRVVTSWWKLMLLRGMQTSSSSEYCSLSDDALEDALLSAPNTPSHFGPLSFATLSFGLPQFLNLRSNVVSLASVHGSKARQMFGSRLEVDDCCGNAPRHRQGLLRPPPSPWLRSRWTSVEVESLWMKVLAEARTERLTTFRDSWPPNFVCGSTALSVLQQCRQVPPMKEHISLALLESDIRRYSQFMPYRSTVFELKNILQEIGLSELVLDACDEYSDHIKRSQPDGGWRAGIHTIVDVGGGNGYLAFQLKVQLGDVDAVVLDPFPPSHRIDNPQRARDDSETAPMRHTIRRITAMAHHIDWEVDIGKGVKNWNRHVALVSKHLCGTSIDLCLRWLDIHHQLPSVMVLSPCCYNKGHRWAYMNQSFLADELGVTTNEGWNRTTKLTDWNHATLRQASKPRAQDLYFLEDEWNYLTSDVVHAALDEGRLLWLRERGYDARLVCFTPGVISPKNVAIVAVRKGSRMLLQ